MIHNLPFGLYSIFISVNHVLGHKAQERLSCNIYIVTFQPIGQVNTSTLDV